MNTMFLTPFKNFRGTQKITIHSIVHLSFNALFVLHGALRCTMEITQ